MLTQAYSEISYSGDCVVCPHPRSQRGEMSVLARELRLPVLVQGSLVGDTVVKGNRRK